MNSTFETYDYIIGGKMVVGRAEMSEDYRMMMENGDEYAIKSVKEKLIRDMTTFMLENQLVEFTYYDDPISFSRKIAVRAYLAPDDQVKVLRIANKIKPTPKSIIQKINGGSLINVYINGVMQSPDDYTVQNNVLTVTNPDDYDSDLTVNRMDGVLMYHQVIMKPRATISLAL
jgi:hypothetical protein